MKRRLLAIAMTLAMALSLLPVTALAIDAPLTGADETDYVTLKLEFGENVSKEDQDKAKEMYEGKRYDSGTEANEAYMALFGVGWEKSEKASPENGKPGYYLHITDSGAPLYQYRNITGSVTEVIFTVHGTVPGFTSIQSQGNNIDCTIGGNHQIFRTSYTVRGVNNADGSKAKITSGNLQAYVAGGYDESFTSSGTLTIENIEFDTGSFVTVGASAAPAETTEKEVTYASMLIQDCIFNNYLYVYDHFQNGNKMVYQIKGNVFDCENQDRALFIQSLDSSGYLAFGPSRVEVVDNVITAKTWVLDCNVPKADFIVQGNIITKTEDTRGAAVQFSNGQSLEISGGNTIVSEGNAIWIHDKFLTDEEICGNPELTVSGNEIDAKYLICDSGLESDQTWGDNTITPTTDVTQGRLNNPNGSETGLQKVTEITAGAIEDTLTNYITVSGISGFEDRKFPTFGAAYDAIKPAIVAIAKGDTGGLDQEPAQSVKAFDTLFTDQDSNGDAAITYTIHGTVTYDETEYSNLLSMGRRSSHYSVKDEDGISRHLIRFFFQGATGRDADTLVVDSNITLPYEWWRENKTTVISFKNLTITGSAPNGLFPYADNNGALEGIAFTVDNCKLEGIRIYAYSNVDGTHTITNNIFEGTDALSGSYAIHLQGSKTEPLTINISDNIISGYGRGINIDQATAVAVISGNIISNTDPNRSTIQLTQLDEVTVSNNTLQLAGGNAITLHEQLADGSEIMITGNTVTGNGYLVYDAAANEESDACQHPNGLDLTVTGNQIAAGVDTTQGRYGGKTFPHTDAVDTVINPYVPSDDSSGSSSSSTRYTVSVEDTDHGSIRVSPTRAERGDTVTITVDPDTGYELDELIVTDRDGDEISVRDRGDGRYTFEMPRGRVTVEATFAEIVEEPEALPFVDVPTGAYYYDAVAWAVENGVTGGTSATTFSPNSTCTRAQMVTFLWRAAGSPEPETTVNPFGDVSAGAYYYDAVLWAVGEGITGGTSATTFSPDATVTRGQTVTFLWRNAGSPVASGNNFADVASEAYYAQAVAWAADEGVTGGTGDTTFSPDNDCTRAQIVTFLWRAPA